MRCIASKLGFAALLVVACAPAAVPEHKQAQDARVLRVLDRMTFGPRPGEAAAVQRVGLKRWLAVQLHPGKIADSALEDHLAAFPAMALPQADLLARFPSRQQLRAVDNQKFALPDDPTEHAIYADALAAQENAKVRKETSSSIADTLPQNASLRVFSRAEIDGILDLAPDARFAQVMALAPGQFTAFRASLKAADLVRLADGLSPARRETLAALSGPEKVVEDELLGARLDRDVYSEREIEAVMTDFWLNHFNVYLRKNVRCLTCS